MRSNVAILSYCSYSQPVCAVSDCNHQRYADHHGYAYVRPRYNSPKWHGARLMLHGTRYKLWSILEELPSYDWVLWIDADALFLRMDESIRQWVRYAENQGAHMLVARDKPGYPFNAGVMLIKNSTWSQRFFERSVDTVIRRPVTSSTQDQPAYFEFMRRNKEEEQTHIAIYADRPRLQAFVKLHEVTNLSWIVHLSCCTDCDTLRFDPVCYKRACVSPPCAQTASVCWELDTVLYSYIGGSTDPMQAGPLGINSPLGRAFATGCFLVSLLFITCRCRTRVRAYQATATADS